MNQISPLVWSIPAAMLVVALAPLPYGYYTLLRIVVSGAAGYLAWRQYEMDEQLSPWAITLGILAALFNPVFPIHLSREIWQFIDVGCAALLGIHYFLTIKQPS